jgi:hypothetical protein
VRNRIQAAEAEISEDVLNEFIADEQAFESYAGKTFQETDPQFFLARAICTDRCAAKALVYLSAPSAGISYTIDELKVDKSDPANANLALAKSLWTHASEKSSSCCSTRPRGCGPGLRRAEGGTRWTREERSQSDTKAGIRKSGDQLRLPDREPIHTLKIRIVRRDVRKSVSSHYGYVNRISRHQVIRL